MVIGVSDDPATLAPVNIMAIANSAHIANLLTEALNTANDNGEKPRTQDGYIKSMSGDLRTAARRVAKELGYDAATVSSSTLKEILRHGATQGPGSMIQTYAVREDIIPFAEEKTEQPVAVDFLTPEKSLASAPAPAPAPAGKAAVIQQMQELMAQALAPDNTVNGVSEQDVIALIEKYAHKPAGEEHRRHSPRWQETLGREAGSRAVRLCAQGSCC